MAQKLPWKIRCPLCRRWMTLVGKDQRLWLPRHLGPFIIDGEPVWCHGSARAVRPVDPVEWEFAD